MHIKDILKKNSTSLSFEFFPPKNHAASQKLFKTINELSPMEPAYVSVTYGAGGSTRELTHDLVIKIKRETGIPVVPHLTCVGSKKKEIADILESYLRNGITNVMALRGDPPKDENFFSPVTDGFKYAVEMVEFIKQNYPEIGIGVAAFPEGHPETTNRLHEMKYLKEKVSAGADYLCTQLFFDNHFFFDFKDRCELHQIPIPIIAGIMPITSLKTMNRIAELSAGTNFPARLLKSLKRCENDGQLEQAGIHWTAEQVRDLLDHNVAGIHFYSLNNSRRIKRICDTLGITKSSQFNR